MIYARVLTGLSLLLGGVLIPLTAQAAEPSTYVSVGAAFVDIDTEGKIYMAPLIRGGVNFNRYLGLEAEAIIGVGDSSEFGVAGGTQSETKLKSQFGGYGVLGFPVSDTARIYGRAGIASYNREVTLTFPRDEGVIDTDLSTETVTGPSLGLGFEVMFGEARKDGLRLDLTAMLGSFDRDDLMFGDAGVYYSAAYVRRF